MGRRPPDSRYPLQRRSKDWSTVSRTTDESAWRASGNAIRLPTVRDVRPGPMSRALSSFAWIVVGVLGFFALMRFVAWDDVELFAIVDALTMLVYLPAWLVAGVAAALRRWTLLIAALAIAAAQIVYVSPELFASESVPGWASHAPRLRLFDANVDKSTEFVRGYSPAIERDRPDVVAFEELTPAGLRHLMASGALRTLPFHCFAPEPGATGLLVASRLPMSRCQIRTVLWSGSRTPYMASATIRTRSGPVKLWVVHTLAPLPSSWGEWGAALRAIDRLARTSRTDNVLLVGDFNATWNNRLFAALITEGLTDAAAARGDPFAMTWPNGAVVPPMVRIDHVLTGNRLSVTVIAAHTGFGSDHHYLTATVALRPSPRSSP